MKGFLERIKSEILIYDGSKGYMLQKLGMKGGECPELWNAEHGEDVREVYRLYKEAGSDVIQTNTFQGGRLQLEKYSLGDRTYELNFQGARLAKEVMGGDGFVAASIGPCGMLLEPLGDLSFEKAYETFAEQIKAVADGGADIINFETFTDVAELRIALLAAKETAALPTVCSLAFEANGRTLMGTDPLTAAYTLKSLGADLVGTNCSFGPGHLAGIIRDMHRCGGIYLSVKPNAGLPEVIGGKTVYRESPEKFAALAEDFAANGVRLIGGCCGTTPEFIRAIRKRLENVSVGTPSAGRAGAGEMNGGRHGDENIITSNSRHLEFKGFDKLKTVELFPRGSDLVKKAAELGAEIIGERALDLAEEEFDAVVVSLKDGTGGDFLAAAVDAAQNYIKEPFIFEAGSAEALEKALRIYKGRAAVIAGARKEDGGAGVEAVAARYGSLVTRR